MKITTLLNKKLHPAFLKYLEMQFTKKNRRFRHENPALFEKIESSDISKYTQYWSSLKNNRAIDPSWFIMYVNLTGQRDVRFVSEGLFYPYIEPVLNNLELLDMVADKNILFRYTGSENSPRTLIRFMHGAFFDEEMRFIADAKVDDIIRKIGVNMIGKPALNSSAGGNISLFRPEEISAGKIRRMGFDSYLLQERIIQADAFDRFNSSSVNSCRIMTLRCPWNGECVILKAMLKTGVGDVIYDNVRAGGLCVGIDKQTGQLSRYAHNYNGERFFKHPTSNCKFSDVILEEYFPLAELALRIAEKVPYMSLLSMDLVLNSSGTPLCIEINPCGQGIKSLQFDGVPLFGDYTDHVILYCVKEKHLNKGIHFKTFYW